MKLYIIPAACLLLAACNSEAPEISLSVEADGPTTISAGESVTLKITHGAPDGLVVFAGDAGHDYNKSALYLLAGKTEEEIRNEVFRQPDPDVVPTSYAFEDVTPGSALAADSKVTLVNANSGDCLVPSEGQVVDGGLEIESTHPDWWYQALRVNLDTRPGANTTLSLRMRFDHDYLSDIYTGEAHPEVSTFMVVIRLAGRAAGGDKPVFCDETVWDIQWAPSTSSSDYTVDLSRVIAAWQSETGLEMDHLDYAQILFTASGSIGYVGKYTVEQVKFGDYDYMPFDTGEVVSTGKGPATSTWTHTYETPGDYTITVLATTTSLKNSAKTEGPEWSDVNAFNVRRELRTIKVHVE